MERDDSKITADLQTRATGADEGELLDVVVELDGEAPMPSFGGGAPAAFEEAKKAFQQDASHVEAEISKKGGEVLGNAWINRTIRARVPAHALPEISKLDRVSAVDAPRKIVPD
jgi:hypothetical protein